MPKNIIFCSDGTWSHPQEQKPVAAHPHWNKQWNTNVAKLADHKMPDGTFEPGVLASSDTQVVLYDDGVGVEFPIVLGGAIGVGIFGKIKQGYAQLAKVYQQGDRLFLFGFSRGAYTARSLAGMLSLIGLPTALPTRDPKAAEHAADKAFDAYMDRINCKQRLTDMAAYQLQIPVIAMQGMWDTVGSLGFTGALFGWNDPVLYGFLDTNLYPNTDAAFHAMAIDEHRGEFGLTPWPGKARAGQTLNQVWFKGVHAEVGGGAPAVPLSDITLSWMLKNAEACGAQLSPQADKYRNVDPMNAVERSTDSFTRLWLIDRHRSIPAGATIANSVEICLERDAAYRPSNVSLDANHHLAPSYQIENVVAAVPALRD